MSEYVNPIKPLVRIAFFARRQIDVSEWSIVEDRTGARQLKLKALTSYRMAARQKRIDAFIREGSPPA